MGQEGTGQPEGPNKDAPKRASGEKVIVPTSIEPIGVLREAIRQVPSVKYALGVVGIAAAVLIVLTFVTDYRVAVVGILVMLGFMVLLVIFQRLSVLESHVLRYPALFVLWAFPILAVIALSLIMSSIFFSWPLGLSTWLLGEKPESQQRLGAPISLTLSLAQDEAPYASERLLNLPEPLKAHYSRQEDYPVGYFMWSELDYDKVLFAIRAGLEMGPDNYMDRETFVADSDGRPDAKALRIWSVFVGIGERLEAVARDRTAESRELAMLLPSPPSDLGQRGIAFLRLVFPEGRPGDDRSRVVARRAILLADRLFPAGGSFVENGDTRLNAAARFLATHRVQPVFNLSAANGATEPVVVTAVRLDVLEVVGAYSALESGPLSPTDTVTFQLGSKPETILEPLASPLKIAGGDAILLRTFLRSDLMFSYLCRFTLLAGERPVGKTQDFLVDFGFQAPT